MPAPRKPPAPPGAVELIRLAPAADRQLDRLIRHYEDLGRWQALANLDEMLAEASEIIAEDPRAGLPSHPAYPGLARPSRRWIHVRNYWLVYTLRPLRIAAIMYETAHPPHHV